jgi:DNA-binding CsgD family transcriptional regulator
VKSKNAYRLTERERAIAMRLSIGLSNKQIAADLGASPYTIRDSLSAIFRKLKARNRVDAAVAFAHLMTLETTPPPKEIGEQSRVAFLAPNAAPDPGLQFGKKKICRELFESEIKRVRGGEHFVLPSDVALIESRSLSYSSLDFHLRVWALS